MQISGIKIGGRVNAYILRQQGVDLTPTTYFQKAFASWSDSDKKTNPSEADIGQLKSKYNSSNMSDKENVDLLGELVQMGVTGMKQSNIIKSYEDYLDILARLAVGKRTVTV